MIKVKAEIQIIHGAEEPVYDKNKCLIELFCAESIICQYDDNDFILINTSEGATLHSFEMIPKAVTESLIDSGLTTGYIDFTKAGIAFRKQALA